MSIVNKIETGIALPPAQKRNRSISCDYGQFILAANEPREVNGVMEYDSYLMECPKNVVHDADLAKKWASSAKGNPKTFAKKHGRTVVTAEVKGEDAGATGYGVRVWYTGLEKS